MPRAETSPSSILALVVLVTLAVAAPWPFGAVQPWAIRTMIAAGLGAATLALALAAVRGDGQRPTVPLWPLLGFLALSLAQVVPLPPALHAILAPGSHAVWHPGDPAAAVLGPGPFPVSLDPDSTVRSVALVAGLGLLAWLAAPAFQRRRVAVAAASVVAAGGFALSVYAIFARTRFGALVYGRFAVPTPSPFGPFVSKNHFAGYVAMAALLTAGLAIGLAASARRREADWTASPRAGGVILALVAALAMALACLASLSRGGAIALVAGAAALLALRVLRGRRARRALLPTLAAAATLGLVLVALVPPATHARMRDLGGASFRLGTWRDGVRLAASSPAVGIGLGAFHDAYPRFKQGHGLIRVEHAENDYVETLAETGLLGLGLALLGGVFLLSAARRDDESSGDSVVGAVGSGAAAGLIALAVHSAVDFNLRIPSNAALAAVLAAAAAGAAGVRARPLPRAGVAVLALSTAGLLVAAAQLPEEPWRAAHEEVGEADRATTVRSQGLRLERAEAALGRVLRRRPAHAESWLLLAVVRAAEGDETAASLARHAVSLDPERPALGDAAALVEARVSGEARP